MSRIALHLARQDMDGHGHGNCQLLEMTIQKQVVACEQLVQSQSANQKLCNLMLLYHHIICNSTQLVDSDMRNNI